MLPWIFLLLSVGAWWIVFTTRSMAALAIALVAALAFLLLGFFGLLSARVGHMTRTQAAREKALLLTTRPELLQGGTRPSGRSDRGAGLAFGADADGTPSAGRAGTPKSSAPGDHDGSDGGEGGGGGD